MVRESVFALDIPTPRDLTPYLDGFRLRTNEGATFTFDVAGDEIFVRSGPATEKRVVFEGEPAALVRIDFARGGAFVISPTALPAALDMSITLGGATARETAPLPNDRFGFLRFAAGFSTRDGRSFLRLYDNRGTLHAADGVLSGSAPEVLATTIGDGLTHVEPQSLVAGALAVIGTIRVRADGGIEVLVSDTEPFRIVFADLIDGTALDALAAEAPPASEVVLLDHATLRGALGSGAIAGDTVSVDLAPAASGGAGAMTWAADFGAFTGTVWSATFDAAGTQDVTFLLRDARGVEAAAAIAIPVSDWAAKLFTDAGLEAQNAVPRGIASSPWTNVSGLTTTALVSPNPYFSGPARLATGGFDYAGRNATFGNLASGEKLYLSVVFIPGTSNQLRLIVRDDTAALQSAITWNGTLPPNDPNYFRVFGTGVGAFSGTMIEDVVQGGVTYKRFSTILTLNQAITAASLRVGPNSTVAGQYVDVYGVGATVGGALPVVTTTPTLSVAGPIFTLLVGAASGMPSPTYAIVWENSTNGGTTWATVAGQTAEILNATGAVDGTQYRAKVTWTNAQGSAAPATSNVSTYVAPYSSYQPPVGLYWLTEAEAPNVKQALAVSTSQAVVEFNTGILRDKRLTINGSSVTTAGAAVTAGPLATAAHTGWTCTVAGVARTISASKSYELPYQFRDGIETFRRRILFTLAAPALTEGQAVVFTHTASGQTISFTYGKAATSFMINIPDHGFTPNGPKRAIVGAWCGEDINPTTGKKWAILDAATGVAVSGWNFNDTKTGPTPLTEALHADGATTVYTSDTLSHQHKTDWIDFSAFTTPGRYRIAVEGYGASRPFDIHADVHLPLAKHVGRGFLCCAHSRDRLELPASIRYPGNRKSGDPMSSRVTGRTVASWGNDGLQASGKLWDGNGTNAAQVFTDSTSGSFMLKESDTALGSWGIDAAGQLGFQDAGDYDFRTIHVRLIVLLAMMGIACDDWIGAADLGWGEALTDPYTSTARGGSITGTVAISHLDRIVLHAADAYARLQHTDTIYDTDGTTPIWTPVGGLAKGGVALGGATANWYGAVSGGIESGYYNGPVNNWATWAADVSPATPVGRLARYKTRPDPYSTYAACAAFGAAALRFRKLGDAKMQRYYTVRAQRAWDWAYANEDNTAAWLTTVNGRTVWASSYRNNTGGNGRFYMKKNAAGAALLALTGEAKYWSDATKPGLKQRIDSNNAFVSGNFDDGALAQTVMLAADAEGWYASGAAGGGLPSSTVASEVASRLTTLRTNLTTTLTTLHGKVFPTTGTADSSTCYLKSRQPSGAARASFTNTPFNLGAFKREYTQLFMMRASLSGANRTKLWELMEGELAFATGRTPFGRPYITGMGDGARCIHHSDWEKIGLRVPPPGLIACTYARPDEGADKQDRYKIDGSAAYASFPFHTRVAHGNGYVVMTGEFNIADGIAPLMCGVLALHGMESGYR